MHPYLESKTWTGEVELDLGDLGFHLAEASIEWSYMDGGWGMGSYKFTININDVTVDVSHLMSKFAIEDIYEQYIVNGEL